MSDNKSFFKTGIIYMIGQIFSKLISFIFIPIYTRELGKVGYGKLALADTVMDFISTFLIISIFSGYIRFYREYTDENRNRLKNTAINFAIIMSILDIILLLLFGKKLSGVILGFKDAYRVLVLIVVRSLISQFITLLMCDYNLNYKANKTVIINTVMLAMNVALSIVLVVIKKLGIIGVYEGYVYSSGIILIYLIIINIKNYKFEFDIKMLKNMLKFSGGLIPEGMSGNILTLADRYFLKGYRGLGETGIYSIGYKFGGLIDPIFINPFKSIFTPYKFEIFNDKNAELKINEMFEKYHFIGLFLVLIIAVYSKFILIIFTTHEYIQAYRFIPIILISYFTYGKAEFYGLGIQIKNKTYINGIVMLCGGMVNIILNILLIPRYGMLGAAIATLMSYMVINFLYLKISNKISNIRYKLKQIYKLYIWVILLYFCYYMISWFDINIIFEFLIGVFICIIYIYIGIKLEFIYINDIYELIFKVKLKARR
ncbi:lipopolysaccharide biosynthesis protein [Clostridium novyi]